MTVVSTTINGLLQNNIIILIHKTIFCIQFIRHGFHQSIGYIYITTHGPLNGTKGFDEAFGYLTEGGPNTNPMSFESQTATLYSYGL